MNTITVGAITIDANDIESAKKSYADATTGEKTKIRNAVTAAMGDAVRNRDMTAALLWSTVSDAIATVVVRTEKVVDYNRVIADRIITLRHAAHRLLMGDFLPDGITADMVDNDTVSALVAEWVDMADNDAVSNEIATAAKKVGTAKITRAAERGSIESHIETAFSDAPVGTRYTVAQIRQKSGAASDGAIAARVWPRDGKPSTLDFHALGVTPCTIDGVRGLEKVSDN